MKIAAFCGTFDPVTYGHLDIIERASKLFDELVVFISPNSDKNNEFTEARRLAWLNASTKHLSNVTCKIQSGLVVEACKSVNATVLVRGIRNGVDCTYEQNMAFMNARLDENIETVCLFTRPEYSLYSSSNVRELFKYGQNISGFVPACVLEDLKKEKNKMEKFIDWLKANGYKYKNEDIYLEACTHSSYANEHHRQMDDNERLEFMGDSVLQIWSATQLFLMEPKMREGQMTTLRAQTVCESTLYVLNRQLGWYEFLRLGVGEEKTGGRNRESILADQFEACIGAIYIDQGYHVCDEILTKYMKPVFKQEKSEAVTDYKTHLQEVIQANSRKTIQYKLLEEKGPSNAPTFTMGVYLDDILLGQGTSSTKKKAEQKAAKDAFEKMAK